MKRRRAHRTGPSSAQRDRSPDWGIPVVVLPERLEAALRAGHPWVYRQHLPPQLSSARGPWVAVSCGQFRAVAVQDPSSVLALRIYSREQVPDAAWFERRVQDAWDLRQPLRDEATDAFRWLYGEADGLPAVVVDYYAGYAVVACDTDAVAPLLPPLCEALQRVSTPFGVLRRHRDATSEGGRLELLAGQLPPRDLVVRELGVYQRANLYAGQKTGLFLDQRENRACVAAHCRGKSVLNLFSYSGGFSVHAVRQGASRVVSVDSAKAAARDAEENFRLNGFDPAQHEFVVADVFEYLELMRTHHQTFDVVICDPPSFARNQTQMKKAISAYTRLNAAGMKVVRPGGLYAAASRTSRLTEAAFVDSLSESACRAQRRFQIIAQRGHAQDHPVLASHPEGRYLKFVLGRILPRD